MRYQSLVGGGRGEISLAYLKIEKSSMILEKIALFVCIYGLHSNLKCSFKSILEKKHKNFSLRSLLLYDVYEVFIQVPLFQESCSGLCACNSHPKFFPNIWIFANLPIHRKLIHDNVILVFENQESIV